MILGLSITATITALLIGLLHWFPWNRVFHKELPPPWTYIVGVSVLSLVYSGWLLAYRPTTALQSLLGFWTVIIAGGLADIATYGIDWVLGLATERRLYGRSQDH